VAGVVAEAQPEQRRSLDVVVVDGEVVGPELLVEDAADTRIGHADKALEVPGAYAADARLGLRRRRKAEIRGAGRCRLA
jgi:hypothetical protein